MTSGGSARTAMDISAYAGGSYNSGRLNVNRRGEDAASAVDSVSSVGSQSYSTVHDEASSERSSFENRQSMNPNVSSGNVLKSKPQSRHNTSQRDEQSSSNASNSTESGSSNSSGSSSHSSYCSGSPGQPGRTYSPAGSHASGPLDSHSSQSGLNEEEISYLSPVFATVHRRAMTPSTVHTSSVSASRSSSSLLDAAAASIAESEVETEDDEDNVYANSMSQVYKAYGAKLHNRGHVQRSDSLSSSGMSSILSSLPDVPSRDEGLFQDNEEMAFRKRMDDLERQRNLIARAAAAAGVAVPAGTSPTPGKESSNESSPKSVSSSEMYTKKETKQITEPTQVNPADSPLRKETHSSARRTPPPQEVSRNPYSNQPSPKDRSPIEQSPQGMCVEESSLISSGTPTPKKGPLIIDHDQRKTMIQSLSSLYKLQRQVSDLTMPVDLESVQGDLSISAEHITSARESTTDSSGVDSAPEPYRRHPETTSPSKEVNRKEIGRILERGESSTTEGSGPLDPQPPRAVSTSSRTESQKSHGSSADLKKRDDEGRLSRSNIRRTSEGSGAPSSYMSVETFEMKDRINDALEACKQLLGDKEGSAIDDSSSPSVLPPPIAEVIQVEENPRIRESAQVAMMQKRRRELSKLTKSLGSGNSDSVEKSDSNSSSSESSESEDYPQSSGAKRLSSRGINIRDSKALKKQKDKPKKQDERRKRQDEKPRKQDDTPRKKDDKPRKQEDKPRKQDDRPRKQDDKAVSGGSGTGDGNDDDNESDTGWTSSDSSSGARNNEKKVTRLEDHIPFQKAKASQKEEIPETSSPLSSNRLHSKSAHGPQSNSPTGNPLVIARQSSPSLPRVTDRRSSSPKTRRSSTSPITRRSSTSPKPRRSSIGSCTSIDSKRKPSFKPTAPLPATSRGAPSATSRPKDSVVEVVMDPKERRRYHQFGASTKSESEEEISERSLPHSLGGGIRVAVEASVDSTLSETVAPETASLVSSLNDQSVVSARAHLAVATIHAATSSQSSTSRDSGFYQTARYVRDGEESSEHSESSEESDQSTDDSDSDSDDESESNSESEESANEIILRDRYGRLISKPRKYSSQEVREIKRHGFLDEGVVDRKDKVDSQSVTSGGKTLKGAEDRVKFMEEFHQRLKAASFNEDDDEEQGLTTANRSRVLARDPRGGLRYKDYSSDDASSHASSKLSYVRYSLWQRCNSSWWRISCWIFVITLVAVSISAPLVIRNKGDPYVPPTVTEEMDHATNEIAYQFGQLRWKSLGYFDIDPLSEAGDAAGSSVSLSSDGTRFAVGSRFWGGAKSPNLGSLALYDLELGDRANYRIGIAGLGHGSHPNEQFGYSVSLNDDGSVIAVGSLIVVQDSNTSQKMLWGYRTTVFEVGHSFTLDRRKTRQLQEWTDLLSYVNETIANVSDVFTMHYDDMDLLFLTPIGEPIISQLKNHSIQFDVDHAVDFPLSISGSGDRFVFGVQNYSGSNAVWVYEKQVLNGTVMWQPMPSSPILLPDSSLSVDVAISGNGEFLAIGSTYPQVPGLVSIYRYDSGGEGYWLSVENITVTSLKNSYLYSTHLTDFARKVDLSFDGSVLAVGAPNSTSFTGSVAVFKEEQFNGVSRWMQQGDLLTGEEGDLFGFDIALSSNGTRLVVGSPRRAMAGITTGATSVFQLTNDEWEMAPLITGNSQGCDAGYSVSISADGSIIASGLPSITQCNSIDLSCKAGTTHVSLDLSSYSSNVKETASSEIGRQRQRKDDQGQGGTLPGRRLGGHQNL